MENRRERGEILYREKFEAYGLDFTFLRREWSRKHDKRFWIRCNRCGSELLRNNDLFKGKANGVRCPKCGNGTKLFSDFSDNVIKFYTEGHSSKETAEKFGISKAQLDDLVKRRGVSNGRKFETVANEERIKDSEKQARKNAELLGFQIFDVWKGEKYYYQTIDLKTGEAVTKRGRSFIPRNYHKDQRKVEVVDKGITIHKLIKRDGFRCYLCGKKTTFKDKRWKSWGPDYPTIDHVKPVKLGGVDSWENVKVCCGLCNVMKGAKYEQENT